MQASKRRTKTLGSILRRAILLLCMLTLLTSMTGCAKHYVIAQGQDTLAISKAELDTLKSDNEALLKALLKCPGGK